MSIITLFCGKFKITIYTMKTLPQLTKNFTAIFFFIVGLAAFIEWKNMMKNRLDNHPQCLNVAITKLYDKYDPSALITTDHVFIVDNIFGKLLYVGESNSIYAGIAESWEVSPDKTRYTLKLNSAARFSDGTQISVDDVIASYKRHLLLAGTHVELKSKILGAKNYANFDHDIEGLKKISSEVLQITLVHPDDKFLYWLAFPELAILPKSEAKKAINELNLKTTSGAFFISGSTNEYLILEANPYFYTERGSASSCLHVYGIENPEDAIIKLKNRQLDVLDYGSAFSPNFSYFYDNPNFTVVSGAPRALVYFVFNTRREFISDVKVRRAISGMIRAESFIPYGRSLAFEKTDQFLVETHEGYLTPQEIKELSSISEDSREIPETLNILYPKVFGEKYKVFFKELLGQQLHKKIEIIEYEEGDVEAALSSNNWDMFFFLVGMGEKATDILFSYHFKGSNLLYPWRDPVIESSMHELENATNQTEKLRCFKTISKRLLSESYIKPLYSFNWPLLMRSDLEFEHFNKFKFNNDLWLLTWKK